MTSATDERRRARSRPADRIPTGLQQAVDGDVGRVTPTHEHLRAVAEGATKGEWSYQRGGCSGKDRICAPPDETGHVHTIAKVATFNSRANRRFIATFNPERALALLAENETLRTRVAELESWETFETQMRRVFRAEAVLREIAGEGDRYPSGGYSNEMARAYFTAQQKGDVG